MGVLKVALEDELERRLRLAIGSRLGMRRGALTKAVSEAIASWIRNGKPQAYFAKGCFFEVPPTKAHEFVRIVIKVLRPYKVTIHIANSSKSFTCEEFMKIVENNHSIFEKPDLLVELGDAKLYHACNGCFMLKAKLSKEQLNVIAENVIELSLVNGKKPKITNSLKEFFVWGDGYVEVKC
jgi:hypothetical protein